MRRHLPVLVLVAHASLAVTWQPVAAAQRQAALEEVLVTAQHRTESVQDIPISLFTLNSQQLEQQRITGIANLNGLVPNLAIDSFPANNQTLRLFIRGVGLTDTQVTQDAAVGIYLNGAYIARSTGLAFDVADLERIEILRGPQGTLYGRNTTGGAIKLVTKKPDTENFTLDQTLSSGNRDLFGARTSLNVPLGDHYAARLAYFYEDVDGFTNNDGPGGDFGDRRSRGLRIDTLADFTDDLTMTYAYDRSEVKYFNYTAQAVVPRESGGSLLSVIGDIAQQYIQYDNNRINSLATSERLLPTDTTINGHTLNLDWVINGDTELRSISAYRDLDDKTYTDFSSGSSAEFRIDFNEAVIGTEAGPQRMDLPIVRPNIHQEQWSQEFQLIGSLNDQWDYLAGLYYFYEKADEDAEPLHHIFSAYPFAGGTIYRLGAESNTIENDAWAFFSQFTWTPEILDSRLHLTLGWRHSEDSRDAERRVTDVTVVDQVTSVMPLLPPDDFNAEAGKDFDDDSFTLIAEYDLAANMNVYAKYAGAYKSGGFNTRDPEEAGFSSGFAEEKLNAVEAGFKGDLLEHMLRLNAAVFYQKFDDFQYNFQIPGTISGTRVFNLDNGEMSGIELDLTAMPTSGLFLQFNYAYLHSKLDDLENPFSGEVQSADFGNAPKHSYSVIADYAFPATDYGVFGINATYSFVDDRNPNAERTYRDGYQLLNARVSLTEIEGLGGQWTVAAWGKNLGEADYEAFTMDNLPQADRAVIWGDGRSYGLDITYHYD